MREIGDALLRERLTAALGVRRWVDDVAAGAPYSTLDDLVWAGDRVAELTDAELDEAVSHHPRIGQRPVGASESARLSSGEQAALGVEDEREAAALAAGNAVYEERFGRVFLIRAAGRTRAEILAELQRRLLNDEIAEAAEAKDQLRQIAALRLRTLFADDVEGDPV